jgi:hypothetical protein
LELDEQVAVLAGVVAIPTAVSGVASMRSYPETPEAPCRVTPVVGQDVDFFPTPNYASKPELGNPVEGAGTLAMITKDSPGARAFIDFIKSSP